MMNIQSHLFFALLFAFALVACNSESIEYKISITNPSDLNRESETIKITFSQLPGFSGEHADQIHITDHSEKELLTQVVEHSADSLDDYLLFQADFKARETRQFTLFQLSKNKVVKEVAVGIAHHNKEGVITFSETDSVLSYWEPQDDSFLGTAIILDSGTLSNKEPKIRTGSDNHWITLKTDGNSFSYRAGFGWEKGGRFSSPPEWNEFVKKHARLEQSPLIIKIDKQ